MALLKENQETKTRLIARVIRELLKAETYETLADLTDALKCRCVRLHVAWTDDDINAAYRLIDSNTHLIPIVKPQRRHERDIPAPEPPIPQATAVATLRRLRRQSPVKRIPAAPTGSQREADRAKALEMVLRELQDSKARCDALEAHPPKNCDDHS